MHSHRTNNMFLISRSVFCIKRTVNLNLDVKKNMLAGCLADGCVTRSSHSCLFITCQGTQVFSEPFWTSSPHIFFGCCTQMWPCGCPTFLLHIGQNKLHCSSKLHSICLVEIRLDCLETSLNLFILSFCCIKVNKHFVCSQAVMHKGGSYTMATAVVTTELLHSVQNNCKFVKKNKSLWPEHVFIVHKVS